MDFVMRPSLLTVGCGLVRLAESSTTAEGSLDALIALRDLLSNHSDAAAAALLATGSVTLAALLTKSGSTLRSAGLWSNAVACESATIAAMLDVLEVKFLTGALAEIAALKEIAARTCCERQCEDLLHPSMKEEEEDGVTHWHVSAAGWADGIP